MKKCAGALVEIPLNLLSISKEFCYEFKYWMKIGFFLQILRIEYFSIAIPIIDSHA